MIDDKHFHPVIFKKLQGLIAKSDFEGLFLYLQSLSNSNFRTAGYLLGERFVAESDPQQMWDLVSRLVMFNSKAFLVTFLKSISSRDDLNQLLAHPGYLEFCAIVSGNEIDVQKVLAHLLPHRQDAQQIRTLFLSLGLQEPQLWIPYLIKLTSIPSYYVLFTSLRYVEHDHDYLVRLGYYLIKKGDGMSYNLASLIRSYFGLEELKGTFSLNLKPYELARIETNYEAFHSIMSF